MSIVGIAAFSALLYIIMYLVVFFKLSKSWQRANWFVVALWVLGALAGADSEYFLFAVGSALLLMPISILIVVLGTSNTTTVQTSPKPKLFPIDEQLRKAALLRIELKGSYLAKEMSDSRYQFLTEQIDQWIETLCGTWNLTEIRRQQLLNAAWQDLQKNLDEVLGKAPWRTVEQINETPIANTEQVSTIESAQNADTVGHSTTPENKKKIPLIATKAEQQAIVGRVNDNITQQEQAEVVELNFELEDKESSQSNDAVKHSHAERGNRKRKNEEKTKLSNTLKNRLNTFFSEFLWRFLWQNIGWFIGGFCFVSGSVFLVAYSSGYNKALAVLGTLSLYAALLFWGGYKIRHLRKDLHSHVKHGNEIVSQVLLILGVLLIPLIFATATRLILHDQSVLFLSLLFGLLSIIGAVFTVRLASGMMERALLHGHPAWFIGLAVMQFFAPLLNLFNHWYALVALHFTVLLMLGVALQQFTQRWLHNLFIDQRKLSYYAAGTLIYAAIVSFIHLTWSNDIALPTGYNGIFLMALSLMLFNVDRHLKQWVEKKAWLDRFSFVIYALSIMAVLVAWLPQPNLDVAVLPLAITLALGAVLYGLMLWHYLTLPPLYLLIIACAGEYALLLRPFPAEAHFLLSIPGLAALLLLRRYLLKRNAESIAQMVSNILLGLIPALVVWSLWQAQPGWTAMFTPLTAALMMLPVLGISIAQLLDNRPAGKRCYLLSAFVWLTLAYAPILLESWALQFSFALLVLSLFWGFATLWVLHRERTRCHANVFIDSSLLSIIAALSLAIYWLPTLQLAGLMVLAGSILLLLSLWLNSRVFIYAALTSFGAAALLFIEHYQIITTGSITLGVGIVFLFAVWWLQSLANKNVQADDAGLIHPPTWKLHPLHLWELYSDDYHNRADMLWRPLEHAALLLWMLGLIKLAQHFIGIPITNAELYPLFGFHFPAFLGVPYLLGAVLTLLIAGQYRQLTLLSLAQVLLTWSLLLFTAPWLVTEQLSLFIIGISILSWWSALYFAPRLGWLWQLLDWQGGYGKKGGRWWTEHILHHTTFVLIALGLLLPLSNGGLELLSSLMLAIVFWAHAAQRYQYPLHAYLVVAGMSLLLLSVYSLFADVRLWLYLDELELGWLLTGLSLGLALLGWFVAGSSNKSKADDVLTRTTDVYKLPLYHLAYLMYVLAISVTFPLNPWINTLGHHTYSFSLLLVVQSLVLLPLLRSPQHFALVNDTLSAYLRGALIPVLLTLALINLLLIWQLSDRLGIYSLVGWAFILWMGAKYYSKWWASNCDTLNFPSGSNQCVHRPMCTYPISSQFAPWWGLFIIAGFLFIMLFELNFDTRTAGILVDKLPTLLVISLAPVIYSLFALQALDLLMLASLAVYLVLMLQLHNMQALRWSAAIAVLLTGLLATLKLFPLGLSLNPPLVLGVLGWLNILLYLSRVDKVRLFTPSSTIKEQAHAANIANGATLIRPTWNLPLLELRYLSIGLLILFLLALAVPSLLLVTQATATGVSIKPPAAMTLGLSLLLSLSFIHLFYLQPRSFYAHWLIFSISITLLLVGMAWLPLVLWLGVWLWWVLGIVWWARCHLTSNAYENTERHVIHPTLIMNALKIWTLFIFFLSLLNLFNPLLSTSIQLLALTLLGSFAISKGLLEKHKSWLLTGLSLLFIALHWLWLLLLPVSSDYNVLLPWYALQSVLLAWVYIELQQRLTGLWANLLNSLPLLPILILLSLSEWWLYLWASYQSLANTGVLLPSLFGMVDVWVMSLAVLLLFGLWLRHAREHSEGQIYLQAINLGLLVLFLRLVFFGLHPPTAWDTAVVLGITALLVALSHLRPNRAVERLALIVPALALLTLPSPTSAHTSLTLFSAAVLYWLIRRNEERQSVSVYLGLLALNLSVYVWIPVFAEQSGLLQIYILPAALSMLLMLQLHWLELKPSVAHAVRLTALSAIYLSATLDVFLRPDFSLFLLALGLSLGGVLLGIALRIKAFLYAGTVFLVFNVIGQLVQYYPEATLSKAIVLMLLGGLITGSMIVFQLQKEAILSWINRVREDLQAWE